MCLHRREENNQTCIVATNVDKEQSTGIRSTYSHHVVCHVPKRANNIEIESNHRFRHDERRGHGIVDSSEFLEYSNPLIVSYLQTEIFSVAIVQ